MTTATECPHCRRAYDDADTLSDDRLTAIDFGLLGPDPVERPGDDEILLMTAEIRRLRNANYWLRPENIALRAENERLKAELESQGSPEPKTGWTRIDAEDKATWPKYGAEVDAYCEERGIRRIDTLCTEMDADAFGDMHQSIFWVEAEEFIDTGYTHWRPLPAPPPKEAM